jgi:hypothetical protein
MQINLTVDTKQLDQFVGMAPRKLAYACANAINATAERIQADIREHTARSFTLRPKTREFMLRQAAILKPRASVRDGRPFAEISVGQKPGLLLPQFETGGARRPFVGKHAAVPIIGGARPTWESSVSPELTFKRMGFIQKQVLTKPQPLYMRPLTSGPGYALTFRRKRRDHRSVWGQADTKFHLHLTAAGQRQWKGQHRTFILTSTVKAPLGGVYQRVGPDRDDIRMIYSFVAEQQLHDVLEFMRIAEQVGPGYFGEEMEIQLNDVLVHDVMRGVA